MRMLPILITPPQIAFSKVSLCPEQEKARWGFRLSYEDFERTKKSLYDLADALNIKIRVSNTNEFKILRIDFESPKDEDAFKKRKKMPRIVLTAPALIQ